jgi:hypothetical protein
MFYFDRAYLYNLVNKANLVHNFLLPLPLALQPFHFFLSVTNSLHHHQMYPAFPCFDFRNNKFDFRNNKFLLCGVVSPTPNPQPVGPGYPFLSGSSPLTCLTWEARPVAYATASIALGIMWPHKPHPYVKVGIPSGDIIFLVCLFHFFKCFGRLCAHHQKK